MKYLLGYTQPLKSQIQQLQIPQCVCTRMGHQQASTNGGRHQGPRSSTLNHFMLIDSGERGICPLSLYPPTKEESGFQNTVLI